MEKVANSYGRLLIRADAGIRIGTGHVMRCLALAQTWQDGGGRVTFVLSQDAPQIEARLKQEGIDVRHLSSHPGSSKDAVDTANLADALGANWVVADGYHFDSQYQKVIKDSGLSLLFIDDTAHAVHYSADIVLNQNIFANKRLYVNRDPYTRLLLGTNYALLRREFLRFRGWKREIPEVARNVLVTLGGGDPDNVTLKVIQALNQMDASELEVKVVVGPSNRHVASLKEAVLRSPFTVRLLFSVDNMAELMAWADMAVTAGGSTCWELAFMGLPNVVLVLAENQGGIAEGLNEAGLVVNLGWHDKLSVEHLIETLSGLLPSSGQRRRMSQRGRSLVDGMGTERVTKKLQLLADMELSDNAHSVLG